LNRFRFLLIAGLVAVFAALLGVTTLLAGGLVKASAGLVASADYLHKPQAAQSVRRDLRADRLLTVAVRTDRNGDAARGLRAEKVGSATAAGRPAGDLALFDAGRLSWQEETAPLPLILVQYRSVLLLQAEEGPAEPAPVLAARFTVDDVSSPLPESYFGAVAGLAGQALERAREQDGVAGEVVLASHAPSLPEEGILPKARPASFTVPAGAGSETALAYAPVEASLEQETPDGLFGRLFGGDEDPKLPAGSRDVAIYDIEAATVYLPNGEKLEAHSGLAHMQDNPRYVREKNRGPTPPNVYDLVMRERRFHGSEAVRLLPSDGRKKYNRDGLLAHPYMYAGGGPRSQSNGCVVFKDYDRFLAAFKKGRITRMIVVRRMKELPTYVAQL